MCVLDSCAREGVPVIIRVFLILALLLVAPASVAAQQAADRADHHEFVIHNFRTESGVTLPAARVVYGTYGRLNAARDNVVLLPSHYMANHHGYDWLVDMAGGDP